MPICSRGRSCSSPTSSKLKGGWVSRRSQLNRRTSSSAVALRFCASSRTTTGQSRSNCCQPWRMSSTLSLRRMRAGLAQFQAQQAQQVGAGDRGMGEHQRLVAFVGQGLEEVLDQEGLAHAVGAVEQAAGPHRHQLFEAVAGLLEGVRGIGLFHRRAEGQSGWRPRGF